MVLFGQMNVGISTEEKEILDSVKQEIAEKSLTLTAELRVRPEFRHGYQNLYPKSHDTTASFFVGQRTRLNLLYKQTGFDFFVSLQDVRVWGAINPRNGQNAPLYFFEVYAEPHFGAHWSMRIGRQKIVYDNQRLFSENDWRNTGNSHDAARFIYQKKNLNTEFLAAFNQSAENVFTTNYQPVGFTNYKYLLVHFLKWKPTELFNVTMLNTADGFQSSNPLKYRSTFGRYTLGGRLEYTFPNFYVTTAAYYQTGKDSSGKKLSAYYLQPEFKYFTKKYFIRLGAELISGTPPGEKIISHNFNPLYGTAHAFNGHLDLFTAFPRDVNGAGLINPYLMLGLNLKDWSFKMDHHLFFTQQATYNNWGESNHRFLAYENDYRIAYAANSHTNIELGGGWGSGNPSLVFVKYPNVTQSELYSTQPFFAYCSLKFVPTLFKTNFK